MKNCKDTKKLDYIGLFQTKYIHYITELITRHYWNTPRKVIHWILSICYFIETVLSLLSTSAPRYDYVLGYYTIPLTCTMLRYYPRYIYSTSPLRTTIIHNTDNTVLYIHYKSSHNYNFMEVLIIMIQHKLAVFMRSC